jgi:hypothetical protein
MSWDTVSNAMVLRMTLKGILEKSFGYLVPGESEEGYEGPSSSLPMALVYHAITDTPRQDDHA